MTNPLSTIAARLSVALFIIAAALCIVASHNDTVVNQVSTLRTEVATADYAAVPATVGNYLRGEASMLDHGYRAMATGISCRTLSYGIRVCAPATTPDGGAPIVHLEEDGSASYADGSIYDPVTGW